LALQLLALFVFVLGTSKDTGNPEPNQLIHPEEHLKIESKDAIETERMIINEGDVNFVG